MYLEMAWGMLQNVADKSDNGDLIFIISLFSCSVVKTL